jgi:hypothetical protein
MIVGGVTCQGMSYSIAPARISDRLGAKLRKVQSFQGQRTAQAADHMRVSVPVMLGTGVGSEIRQPLGYAIAGGLAVSQLLTLYTTPAVYIYLDRLQTWLFGRGRRAETKGATLAATE